MVFRICAGTPARRMPPKSAPARARARVWAKGNTVAKCLAAIGVEDAAKTLEGCESLEAEFRVSSPPTTARSSARTRTRAATARCSRTSRTLRGTARYVRQPRGGLLRPGGRLAQVHLQGVRVRRGRPDPSPPLVGVLRRRRRRPVPIYRVEPAKSGRSGCSMAGRGPTPDASAGRRSRSQGRTPRRLHRRPVGLVRALGPPRLLARARKIHQGLPRLGSPEAEDPAAFEAALLSMNEVLLSGVEELEPEIRQLLVRHVMDPTKWAALQVKKIAGAAPADKSKGKGKGKGKGKRAAPEPSSAEPVPSVPVDAGASKRQSRTVGPRRPPPTRSRPKRPPSRRNLPRRRLPRWFASRRRPRRLRVRRRRRWLAVAAGNSSSRCLDPARVCARPALCAARRWCSPASSPSSAAAGLLQSARALVESFGGRNPPCRAGRTLLAARTRHEQGGQGEESARVRAVNLQQLCEELTGGQGCRQGLARGGRAHPRRVPLQRGISRQRTRVGSDERAVGLRRGDGREGLPRGEERGGETLGVGMALSGEVRRTTDRGGQGG